METWRQIAIEPVEEGNDIVIALFKSDPRQLLGKWAAISKLAHRGDFLWHLCGAGEDGEHRAIWASHYFSFSYFGIANHFVFGVRPTIDVDEATRDHLDVNSTRRMIESKTLAGIETNELNVPATHAPRVGNNWCCAFANKNVDSCTGCRNLVACSVRHMCPLPLYE